MLISEEIHVAYYIAEIILWLEDMVEKLELTICKENQSTYTAKIHFANYS